MGGLGMLENIAYGFGSLIEKEVECVVQREIVEKNEGQDGLGQSLTSVFLTSGMGTGIPWCPSFRATGGTLLRAVRSELGKGPMSPTASPPSLSMAGVYQRSLQSIALCRLTPLMSSGILSRPSLVTRATSHRYAAPRNS